MTVTPKFRTTTDPRRYIPTIWWNGQEWTMSVHDPHDTHRVRCSHSWTEALTYAHTWAHINASVGLI